ncbi:hypothetical protein N7481_000027 [Penicillium waksmanii]|uniref:uncharacterized protein n=1 Tax=Penicillium waksmanii TaxID=69791 RepID=UPI0025475733|nr:uncharacterized protein N7481_000027 [Penicillium waksmanii]KAJ5999618.1 hypothetical protein N7481_000027 [Penicillium waksmanii]
MSSGFLPLLVSVLHADLSHAILDDIAPRTKFPPTATLGPDFIAEPTPFKNLSKRADHIPPNFCGWFSGSDYGTRPYCATFTYGSDYRSFVCMSEKDVEYQLEPYWEGFSDPIAFPVYTGSSGISTGTQYPVGYFASVSSTRSDSDSGTSKDSGSTSSTTQGNTGSSSDHGGSSSPIGAIVGGVIGGLALISLIVGAIILFVGRGRRRRQGQHHQDSLGFQNGPESYARSPQPPSSTMSNVFPSYTAVPNTLPSEPPPGKPSSSAGAYEDQADLGQQAELPGAQPLYPEYMSAAQRPVLLQVGIKE